MEMPKSYEDVYQTLKKNVPKNLEDLGFIGEASVKVIKDPEGKFIVQVDAEFKEGVNEMDLLPTSRVLENKEEALKEADDLINNIENWDKID